MARKANKPDKGKSFESEFLKAIEEQSRQIDIQTELIRQLELQQTAERENQYADIKSKCKSCTYQFECKRRYSSEYQKIASCQRLMQLLAVPIAFSKSIKTKTGKLIIPESQRIWKKRLVEFTNRHLQ